MKFIYFLFYLDSVPVVLLVIDGGRDTIKKGFYLASIIQWYSLFIILVHECIIKNKIPVVLMEGTGGCCDLFAKCYHLYNEYRPRSRTSVETKFVKYNTYNII